MPTINNRGSYDSLRLVRFAFYLFGLTTVRKGNRQEIGRYRRSPIGHLQCLINLVFYTVCFHKYVNRDSHILHYGSRIIALSHRIQTILHLISMLTVLLVGVINSRKLCKLYEDIDNIDANINSNGETDELQFANYTIYKKSFVILIIVHIGYYIIIEMLLSYLILGVISYRHLLNYIYPCVVSTSFKIQFYLLTCTLAARFNIINGTIERLDVRTDQFISTLDDSIRIHQSLVAAARNLNECYGLQLLLSFVLILVMVLANGYICLYLLIFGIVDNFGFTIYCGFKYFLLNACEGLLLAKACYDLCQSANRSKYLVHSIQVGLNDAKERSIIIFSSLQLANNELKMTACELFDIDYEFFASIFTCLATYLLIMLQFDLDFDRGRSVQNPNE